MQFSIRKFIIRILLICFGFIMVFIPLELLARTVLPKSQQVTIEELVPNENANVLATAASYDKRHEEAVYYNTKTGRRLLRNAKITIRNYHLSHQDVEIKTNSLGQRYGELVEKQKGEYRILALGDSITFEDYLNEENTYPYYLEKMLNDKFTKKNKDSNIKIVNAGVGAIGSENELSILKETGLSIQPDIVFLQLFLNDANESFALHILRPTPLIAGSYFINYLYDLLNKNRLHNYSYQFTYPNISADRESFLQKYPIANTDWKNSTAGFNRVIYENFPDWGYAWSDHSTEVIKNAILAMNDLTEEHNSKLVVGIFPVSYQVYADIVRDEPQTEYATFLKQNNIPYIDLLPLLRQKYISDKEDMFYDQAHCKPVCNEFIAQKLSVFLSPLIDKNNKLMEKD